MQTYEIFTIVFGPLTQFISSMIVALVSVYVVSKTTKLNTKRHLLSDIYLPIFNVIEPHIYKELSVQTASDLISKIEAITKNTLYVPPTITMSLHMLQQNITKNVFDKDSYIQLCKHIDHKYNKLCKSLGFPARTLLYRIQKNQFPSKLYLYFAVARYITTNTVVFIVFLLFSLLLMAWVLIFVKSIAPTIL